jgi:hypothetical protein
MASSSCGCAAPGFVLAQAEPGACPARDCLGMAFPLALEMFDIHS